MLLNRFMAPAKELLCYAADIILPPVCVACRTHIDRHHCLCASCWRQIKFIVPPLCDRLGTPMPYKLADSRLSAAAIAWPPIYNRARAVAHYEGPVKHLIHALKYADRHASIKMFGGWLAAAGRDLLEDADLIIPVPLSRRRLWSRRFNQSALLARELSRHCNIPVDCLSISRVKHTPAQVGLTKKQRQKNVAAAFLTPESRLQHIADRKIVLIDDVMTTGATINACTKTLLRANAARVDVLTLARVVEPVLLDD